MSPAKIYDVDCEFTGKRTILLTITKISGTDGIPNIPIHCALRAHLRRVFSSAII